MANLNTKVELSVNDLRNIFIAGGAFTKDTIDFEIDEVEEVTEPDFGDFIKINFGIELE